MGVNIREEFEQWASENLKYGLWVDSTNKRGQYTVAEIETAWQAWQAARESEGGEAVAIVDGSGVLQWMPPFNRPDPGTRLYTHPPKQQSGEFVDWYCAHCKRGVDGSEVTFNEQHQECGRVITNDEPPTPQPDKWIRITEDCARMSLEALEKFTRDIRNGATGDPEPIEHYYGMQAIDELISALPTPPGQESE